jgi:uncharacterized membrane protein YhaH (DUF805 family)
MVLPLKRYAEFSGRSRRMEYWMYTLFTIIVSLVIGAVEGAMGISASVLNVYGPLSAVFVLGTFIPGLAVGVRRLHDIDRTGWWLLLQVPTYGLTVIAALANGDNALLGELNPGLLLVGSLAVIVAGITLLIFMATDGTGGPNQYGPDPMDPYDADVFA